MTDTSTPTETRIVFTAGRPAFLRQKDCAVIETFDFGVAGGAAVVDATSTDAPLADVLGDDGRVLDVEAEFEASLRTLPDGVTTTSDGVATIEDARTRHEIPASAAGGDDRTIVAMDSGVDTSHAVFADHSIEQVDVSGNGRGDAVGHGTGVLSEIARLDPDAELISLRIFGSEGRTSSRTILRAYEWLLANANRIDVVNMSWGASERSNRLDDVHNQLVEKGVRDVVAAGNTGDTGGSPATAERAFSVGACTETGEMAPFSSYNPDRDNPDVTAIGVDNRLAKADGTAMGADLEGPWVKASGTSFAAPIVTAMVSRYLGTTDTGIDAVPETFEAAAADLPNTPRDGAGVAVLPSPTDTPDAPTTSATVWSLSGDADWIQVDADWLRSGDYSVERTDDQTLAFTSTDD